MTGTQIGTGNVPLQVCTCIGYDLGPLANTQTPRQIHRQLSTVPAELKINGQNGDLRV